MGKCKKCGRRLNQWDYALKENVGNFCLKCQVEYKMNLRDNYHSKNKKNERC